jgi:pimeloyl-ACP methyl ester carboxylesterase
MSVARNGEVEIYYEAIGPAGPPVLLMINGLGSQCINYATEWCERYVARGLQVIRFDNRDVGLSTHLADAPVDERNACYRLSDMADDAIAVLDAADVEAAHVMGLSMGGMIVQQLAIDHRDRLLSATSVMSSTGEAEYGQSTPEAYALLTGPPATDRESAIARHIAGQRVWGSPAFADEERWAADAGRAFDRNFDPAGVGRQFFAVGASGSRADGLRGVTTPTLVMHGSADTLITPSGGERTAELIPGARFELIEGMGHDYPPQLWDRWVDLVCGHIEAAPVA